MRHILAIALALAAASPALAQARFNTSRDGSGTVTTGGTSQQVFGVNADRAWLFCENPVAATETLDVNIGNSASTTAGSIELAPGGVMQFLGAAVPTGVINVTAATSGHRYVCKQGDSD